MTTVDQPTDAFVASGDLRIHYLDWGNAGATPFILLHHNQSNAHTWNDFARRVRDRYHVIAMDMRGHGDSSWAGLGNYTTEHHASDVIALMKHLDLHNTILLGGSTGGRVALVAGALAPERTGAVIMEDVGAVRPPAIAQGFADRVAGGDPELDSVDAWAERMYEQNTRVSRAVHQRIAQHGTKRLANGKFGLKRDILIQRDFIALELWQYVERLKAPLLVMPGSLSEIVGQDQQERFRQIRPDVEIVTIPDAGHHIVHEQPEAFDATVLAFLQRHGL